MLELPAFSTGAQSLLLTSLLITTLTYDDNYIPPYLYVYPAAASIVLRYHMITSLSSPAAMWTVEMAAMDIASQLLEQRRVGSLPAPDGASSFDCFISYVIEVPPPYHVDH